MKKARNADGCVRLGVLLLAALPAGARALDADEWKFRQAFTLERAGIVKLTLLPSTLDAARPGLPDLRLVDSSGREVAYVLERATPAAPPTTRMAANFRSALTDTATVLMADTDYDAPLTAIALETPAPAFLKPARVEISSDGNGWQEVASAAPLFRQFGAAQLQVSFAPVRAQRIRITINDARTRPVPFSGARLSFAAGIQPAVTTPLPVRIARREEYAGESVLVVDLGAKNVPLAELQVVTPESLFARTITVNFRELHDNVAVTREFGRGAIYRVAADGLESKSQLSLPLQVEAPAREMLLHIANGDSPPLAVEEIRAQQRPVWMVFRAAEAGMYRLLTGNPDIARPHYDLATLAAALRQTAPATLVLGEPESNPSYRRSDALALAALRGAELDPAPWKFRKVVQIAAAGVQQLELDLDVLAGAKPGLADLRLLRDGAQVPYLLERPTLSRSMDFPLQPASDPKRPSVSRWSLSLPSAGLPLTRVSLSSTTPLFQRELRVYEVAEDDRRGRYDRALGEAQWSVTPGNIRPAEIALRAAPITRTILIETDNRDNPPIALERATVAFPVARLLFRTESGPVALYYGNRDAGPARYDLALMAGQILAADKQVALLGAEEIAGAGRWAHRVLAAARGGPLFWTVLSLVVVTLLVVIAKLLPKPPEPGA